MDRRAFGRLATTTYADVITRDRVMDHGIRAQWMPIPRIAGPAFPVRNEPDGLVRDIGESRENRFPIFSRGVIPIPARRGTVGVLSGPVTCGGVSVAPGDIVVADEEGIVVLEDRVRAHRDTVDALAKTLGIDA